MNLSTVLKSVKAATQANAPIILTVCAAAGVGATIIFSFKAAPKAAKIVEEKRKDLESIPDDDKETQKVVKKELVKELAPVLAPVVITGGLTVACIIFAHNVNARRQAALAIAYQLSENTLREYQDKVKEVVGPKKEQAVRDEIDKDHVNQNPLSKNQIIVTGNGKMLCYDTMSGRYFESSPETIKQAVNELNRDLLSEMYMSMNDFYMAIGLPVIKHGDHFGWNVDSGLIDVSFSSQLTDKDEPCLVINYDVEPRFDYTNLH